MSIQKKKTHTQIVIDGDGMAGNYSLVNLTV